MIKMAVDFDSRKSWISSELEKLSMGTYHIGIKILLSKNLFQKKLDQWKKARSGYWKGQKNSETPNLRIDV